jgi:hypothetical protein
MRKVSYLLLVVVLLAAFAVPALSSGGAVNGGGQLREELGSKRAEWHVISFGVWAEQADGGYVGELEVNFHNVDSVELDGTKFHGTEVAEMNFYTPTSDSCQAAMNMKVYGEWDHQPGYYVIFRSGDAGSSDFQDTVRVELHRADKSMVYDTHAGDFADQSNCVGTARTGLDAGNITIVRP